MPGVEPLIAKQVLSDDGSPYPEPFASKATSTAFRQLAAHFGLSQFGVNLITLDPGAQSGLRHWHSLEDEFLFVLEGEITLRLNNGVFKLTRGMCMGFKAGDTNAHVVDNRSGAVAIYLIIGSKIAGDNSFYPDDDLAWFDPGSGAVAVHKDGTPYP